MPVQKFLAILGRGRYTAMHQLIKSILADQYCGAY